MVNLASVPWSRRMVLALVLMSALAGLLLTGVLSASKVQATTLDSACTNGNFCVWAQPGYSGAEADFGGVFCCAYHYYGDLGYEWNSAKNRLGGRSVKIYQGPHDNNTIKACIDPDEERPDPGRFNAYQMQNNPCGS